MSDERSGEQGPEMGREGTWEEGSMRDFEDGPADDATAAKDPDRSGIAIGAGMGGSLSYDADGPISTTLDDPGNGDSGNPDAEPDNSNRGSTGGRSAGL